MKTVFAGLLTAFSLYSAIPMPRVDWSDGSRRYAMCFFPLIGVFNGAAGLLWFWVCREFGVAAGLYAAVATLVPLLITGGIHMDGFIDTADAISSHAVLERKLEILKDSHVGAFGVLYCAGQLLLSFGLWYQLFQRPKLLLLVMLGYILSRCYSALSVATFRPAKNSGLVYAFADSAAKREVVVVVSILLAATVLLGMWVSPVWGIVLAVASAAYFLLHLRFCMWEFGGNTGDLAGFMLQNMELLALAVAVIGGLWR